MNIKHYSPVPYSLIKKKFRPHNADNSIIHWTSPKTALARTSLHYHLSKMPTLASSTNSDLHQGFTVTQVAQKQGWTEPMVWSLALEGRDDQKRFRELGWGLRTWDQWNFNDCDKRFGDDWPGRIPAQLIAHILFYFSRSDDLVLDPMAGGGVTPDTCLALGRRCWSFDMMDRSNRPEIEPHTWAFSSKKRVKKEGQVWF